MHSAIKLQSNFNGSNTFRTMKISSRQGLFELVRVDYSDYSGRSGGFNGVLLDFLSRKGMLFVLIRIASSKAILMRTHNIPFSIYNRKSPLINQICSYGTFSKGLKNEFETARINEPLKFYCIYCHAYLKKNGRNQETGILCSDFTVAQ